MLKIHSNKMKVQIIIDNSNSEISKDDQSLQASLVERSVASVASQLRPFARDFARGLYRFARPLVRPLAHRVRGFLTNDLRADISRVVRTSDADNMFIIRRDQLVILRELQEIRNIVSRLESQVRSGTRGS